MLLPLNTIIGTEVLSLHSGRSIAKIKKIIIDPYNLEVFAFKISGYLSDSEYLLANDIREISSIGFLIDSTDELVTYTDVIRLQKIIELDFELINLPVFDKKNNHLGKISSFSILAGPLLIMQLVIKRPFLKSFVDSDLIINRHQIIEMTQEKIIIESELANLKKRNRESINPNFINPFRKEKTSTQTIKSNN